MAHITCSAEKVKLAAIAAIKRIEKIREERDNAKIARVIANKRKGWFWNRRNRTIDEAIIWLDENSCFGWHSEYGYYDLPIAKNLLVLAKHGDPVVIDTESARVLWGHLED